MKIKEVNEFSGEYSEDKFWSKVKRFAKKLGGDVLVTVVTLYLVSKDSETPIWARSTIIAALGYFILPVDMIPDVLIGVGYTDDVSILTGAVATVANSIKESHRTEAEQRVKELLN